MGFFLFSDSIKKRRKQRFKTLYCYYSFAPSAAAAWGVSAAGTGAAAAAAAAVVVAVDDAAAVGLVLRDGVPAPALVAAVAAVLEAVEPVGL